VTCIFGRDVQNGERRHYQSLVCGKMRPPPPPRQLRDSGVMVNCGWMDGVTIVMEQRLIHCNGDEVLVATVGWQPR
jgi:hypothetical protein